MAGKRPVHSLLYGDVVFLYCKTGGYVFSEVCSTSQASIVVFPTSSKVENDPNFPNLKMAAFKVLAAGKVKAQQRLADIHKTLLAHGQDTSKLSPEEREVLMSAEKNAEVEIRNNRVEQERVSGTLVLYGNTVQLLHVFSGKYVAINPVETSKTENINVQAELTTENSENLFFKILPRYKVKSIGHEVYLHDQVTFGVVKSVEGQYLHTSQLPFVEFGIKLYGECREVNIASIPSGYTLKPHYRTSLGDEENKNIIKAGSIVRLFHREIECYLVAEGSFANSDGEVVKEDVHLRKRKSEHGKLRPPSTSAITYWQIEKDEPLSGQGISWQERCRLKHLPTRLYLAVVRDESGSLKVMLKDRQLTTPDLDTVFRLTPVIEEDAKVTFETYARIKHPLTNSWLSATNAAYTSLSFDPNATGLNALQWDVADLKQIGVTFEMNYDDAFTIEEVAVDLIQKFNSIAEVIPIITAYTAERASHPNEPISFQDASVVIEALDVITNFIGSAYTDVLDRQKLLRNLLVIELVVQILKTHNPETPNDSTQQMVSKACYQVLEAYLKGENWKNNLYLARFIPMFRKHIGLGLKAENVLTEMMRDNEQIISGYDLEEIGGIIDNLLQTKDSHFLDFLSVLCVCNGRPIVEHQDYITENLLCRYTKELFYYTGVGRDLPVKTGSLDSIYFCKPDRIDKNQWEFVHFIIPGSKEYQFLLAQLDLFGKLCKGNNRKAIKVIDKDLNYMTFAEALCGAKDTGLNPTLRSKYVELLIVLYVDADEINRAVLENLSLSFNYNEVRENPYEEASKNPNVALTGAENVHFPVLRDWIKDYVASQQDVVSGREMMNNNIFTGHVLDLLYLLVKYGYYANLDDIDNLMPLLLSLLDGISDMPYIQATPEEIKDYKETGRFNDTEENRPVFKLKVKVLKIMNLFFNFRFYLRLQNFVFDYKLLKSKSGIPATGFQLIQDVDEKSYQNFQDLGQKYPIPPSGLMQLENCPEELSIHQKQHLMVLAMSRLNMIFSFSQYKFEKSGLCATRSLPAVLLDLANYDDDEILCESFHLLNRYYSSEDTLFEKAIQTQLLINPNSKIVLIEVTTRLLPSLRHLAQIDVSAEQRQELIETIERLTFLCHLKGAVHQPHHHNQQILYNTGVFSDIINLVFRKERRPPKSAKRDTKGKSQIISTSLRFLKMLARNHKVVQERLFDCMDSLLEIKVAIPGMAELLTEVFTGVKDICLKIKETQIEQIFKLIVKHNGCPELLELLLAVIKAEDIDLPLKRNQAIIIKYFNLSRSKFCDEFLGKEPEKEQRRETLLLYSDDSDHDLQVLLRVIDLLAACCEGENLFIESLCQNSISICELMKILNNHMVQPNRKKPFVLFLLWVYVNTGKNPSLTGSIQLTHSQEMWGYLEHINLLLHGIVKVMRNLPKAAVQSMKLTKGIKTVTERTMTSHSNVPYVTDANGILIPGVLLYIMEGVLPLIKFYYSRLFNPYKSDESVYQKEIQVSADIAGTLLHLADVMITNDYFSSQEQWTTLCDAVITVMSHNCYNEGLIDVDVDVKARFNERISYQVVIQSNAIQAYLGEYKQEKELNDNFNNFVQNFQLAYWGPNNAQHQINSPYSTTYSEYVEGAEFKEKGDNWLPLGSKHQEHVACFVDYTRQQNKTTAVLPITKRVIDYLVISYENFGRLNAKKQLVMRLNNVKYLQLLRTIIHNEIMFVDPTLREQGHNPQEFRRQSECIRAVQNQIQEFGNGSTVTTLVKLLSHPDEKISAEVLAFLTILLFSGNHKVQESFCSYLLRTREEKLFVSMHQRLEQAAHSDNERRILLAQLSLKEKERTILNELYADFAVQYGFRKATLDSFAVPGSKRMSSIEEEPFAVSSSKRKLIDSRDSSAIELQEVQPHFKIPLIQISGVYSLGNTARKLSMQSALNLMRRESSSGVRTAKIEIQQQKQEAKTASQKSAEQSKLASLKFRDTSYIELTLRFLGLLCDGQNRVMQVYFREQPDNIKTINLVSETCIFLQSFYVEVTKENIDLITEVLLTLIEMCVGNFANQLVIYNHHIIDVINRLLQTTVFHQCTLSKVLLLKSTAVDVLEVMCEETSPQSKELVQDVFKAVDVTTLHSSLAYFYRLSRDEEMKRLNESDDAKRAAFATYHVLIHFADFEGITMDMIVPKLLDDTKGSEKRYKEIKETWAICQKQSRSIEVLYEGDDGVTTLAKVHFRVPETNKLSDEIKEKVKYNVDRTSPEDKIRDFSKWIDSVKREVQHLNYLRAHWYTNIFVKKIRWRNHLLFLWTLLMNILMLIAWNDTVPKRNFIGTQSEIVVPTIPEKDENWFFSFVLYIAGGIHLLMSVAMVITYFLINGSNFVMPNFFYKFLRHKHSPTYSDVPFFGLRTMYHIAFVVLSALSLPFYGYFYCFCLFHIVVNSDILQRVLKSVTKNGDSLLWVAALGLIVIYIYAVGTFAFMPNEFDNQDDGEIVRYCDSLFECSVTVLEYGLLDTIGLTVDLPRNFRDFTLRAIFYDLTFFIIVTTIGLNIVFGIIVDTFSELRDERYHIEQDKKGFCFICNISSFEFERRAQGFDFHVKNEHSMWDYIYYVMYLEEIDVSDHNAIEHYVYRQMHREDKNTGYFPLFQARSLQEKQDDTLTELSELKKLMSSIVDHHQEEQKNAAIRKNIEEQAEWERKYQTDEPLSLI